MSVIYSPKGKAGEYAELALNIFTRCSMECSYCYGPSVMRVSPKEFSKNVVPKKNLLENLEKDLKRGYIKGSSGERITLDSAPIHMCFLGDPYPFGINSQITRECITLIKKYGYNVQILTKGGLSSVRDFDLLGDNDWYGFSFTGYNTKEWEPYADSPENRIKAAELALQRGIKTWVSCEPVLVPNEVEAFLKEHGNKYNLVKIGKPNYMEIPDAPDWVSWGKKVMETCNEYGVNAVLKSSLKGE